MLKLLNMWNQKMNLKEMPQIFMRNFKPTNFAINWFNQMYVKDCLKLGIRNTKTKGLNLD